MCLVGLVVARLPATMGGPAEVMPYFEVQLTQKLQRVYDVGHDTTIGRAPQCQIQLLSRAVSRRHARIEVGDLGELIVSDLGTKNGIKLNGKRIQGAAVIREGDKLVVGDVSMVFRAADRTVAPQDAIDLRRRVAIPADAQASMAPKASFLLPAREDQIAHFQAQVARARIDALELDELTKFKLQIALKEATDNARVHGCGGDPNRTVQVTFNETEDEFMISVKDDGPGYDVEQVLASATEVDALEAIRNRGQLGTGLGLRIILNCVDRLQFEARGSTIHMGRFKDQGQIFVISEEGEGAAAAAAGAGIASGVELESEDTGPLDRDQLELELEPGEVVGGQPGSDLGSTPFDESEEQGPLQLDEFL